jgi:multicomponent Na+:H+ antiporter subunit E
MHRDMPYFLLLLSALSAFWLLLSGYWDNPLLLGLGFASACFVAWLGIRMARGGPELVNLRLLLRLPPYWTWLVREIVKANIDVVRHIWRPGLYPISPSMERLASSQRTAVGRMIYAQSITLTPGTVAIEVIGGGILVHALTRDGLDDLRRGEMDRRVTGVEGGGR